MAKTMNRTELHDCCTGILQVVIAFLLIFEVILLIVLAIVNCSDSSVSAIMIK